MNGYLLKGKEFVKRLLNESRRLLERKVDLKIEIEKEKKTLEMEIQRLKKEVAEVSESSFYFKQEKEENGKVISELVKRIEEGGKKENDGG